MRIKKHKEPISNSNLLFLIAIAIFFVMYAIGFFGYPGSFRNLQTFVDFFNNNAPLIILTCGMSIVMIGGGIDISVGGVTGLVTMCCAVFLNGSSGSVFGSMLLALGIGLAFGVLHGFLISYLNIQPFIITLAGMFLANGLLTVIHKNPLNVVLPAFVNLRETSIRIPWLGTVNRLGNFIPLRISIGTIVVLVVVIVLAVIMKWSRFGRNLYAIGGNSQSALMLGINVKRTRFFSYVLCGLLSGIAGYTFLMQTGAGNVGNASGFEMRAIASSIIGGTMLTGGVGNLLGSPFGTLSLLIINEIIRAAGINSNYQAIISGLLLFVFIVMQSTIIWIRLNRRMKSALVAEPEGLPGQMVGESSQEPANQAEAADELLKE